MPARASSKKFCSGPLSGHKPVTLVANQALRTPPSRLISTVQVPGGFDVADNEIVRRTDPGDLVITSDIPLAAEVIDRQALALSPRGELFSKNNIGARLNMRDFLETMRGSGEHTGGPAPFSNADKSSLQISWIACSPAVPASAYSPALLSGWTI